MTSERRSMLHIRIPSDVMDELVDAALRRKTSVGAEAVLWIRVTAEQYKATRQDAGEELLRPTEHAIVPPSPTAWRNRHDN